MVRILGVVLAMGLAGRALADDPDDDTVEARFVAWTDQPQAIFPPTGHGVGELTCDVLLQLDGNGAVSSITVSRCPDLFAEATRAAVSQWRAQVEHPISVHATVVFQEPIGLEVPDLSVDDSTLSTHSDYVPSTAKVQREGIRVRRAGDDADAGPVPETAYVAPTVEWVHRSFPKYPADAIHDGYGAQKCTAVITLRHDGSVSHVDVAGCAAPFVAPTIASVSHWRARFNLALPEGAAPPEQVRTSVVVSYPSPPAR